MIDDQPCDLCIEGQLEASQGGQYNAHVPRDSWQGVGALLTLTKHIAGPLVIGASFAYTRLSFVGGFDKSQFTSGHMFRGSFFVGLAFGRRGPLEHGPRLGFGALKIAGDRYLGTPLELGYAIIAPVRPSDWSVALEPGIWMDPLGFADKPLRLSIFVRAGARYAF